MKPLLKAISILAAVLAVLYLSSPWWIPKILARQLPADWQLETLKISWPGLSGINLKHIEANGKLPGVGITVDARNSRLSYKGLATNIDTAVLHIYLLSDADKTSLPLSIDDLSLPRLHLGANLPELSIEQAQIALHLAGNSKTGQKTDQPLVIALQGFKLNPAEQGHFQLDTAATIVGQQHINGHFEVAVSPAELSAHVRFPADSAVRPWLNIELVQVDGTDSAKSKLKLQFDEDATSGQWLDALLNKSSDGRLTHVGGQLQAHAIFNGDQTRPLSQLSLNAKQFRVDFEGSTGVIDADIQATREAQTIRLEFFDTTDWGAGRLLLIDRNKVIEALITSTVPELKRSTTSTPEVIANAVLSIASGSQLLLNLPENVSEKPSLSFNGGLALVYSTSHSSADGSSRDGSSIQMKLDDLIVGIAGIEQAGEIDLAHIDLSSELSLSWNEKGPFSYANDKLSLAANSLSLQASGKLALAAEQIGFQPTGRVDAKLPGLQTKVLTGDPSAPGWIKFIADDLQTSQAQLGFEMTGPAANSSISYFFEGPLSASMPKATLFSSGSAQQTTVTANELNVIVTLVSDETQFKTDGSGYLSAAEVMPLAASASRLDLNWTDLNLTDLIGTLGTKTKGFKVSIEEETWTGFDLDANLQLLKDDNIKGSGSLSFGSSTALPIEFSGNTGSGWWDINLPSHTLPLKGLRKMLRSAHIELSDDLKLTAGSMNVAGLIQVHDEISAKLDLSGADMAADLAESNAQQANFRFDAGYLKDVFATGPVRVEHLELAGGVDIADLSLDLNLENSQTFGMSNISAGLFDGQLKIDQINFADTAIEDTTISLTHISLEKLLAYLDVDGLEGTGFIDFSLPAGSRGTAFHIIDGTFTSTGPGRLAYSKGNMADANIGLKALENFHYQELSGKIAYDSTGPYEITLHLEGSNPDLYDGYPVVFNLTIHGTLPELFEAMFLTGSFEESILKQIKVK